MALGLTQPLKEMVTRNIFWGVKGGWGLGLTAFPPLGVDYFEIWKPVQGLLYNYCLEIYFVIESRDSNICLQKTVLFYDAPKTS